MTADSLIRLVRYDARANRLLLDALRRTPEVEDHALRVFAHLVASPRVWWLRMQGADASTQPIWPEPDLDALADLLDANEADYAAFLDGMTPDELAAPVRYTNTQGHTFETAVGDIVMHVVTHGAYHRGQVAAALRRADADPPPTDFVRFARGDWDG